MSCAMPVLTTPPHPTHLIRVDLDVHPMSIRDDSGDVLSHASPCDVDHALEPHLFMQLNYLLDVDDSGGEQGLQGGRGPEGGGDWRGHRYPETDRQTDQTSAHARQSQVLWELAAVCLPPHPS
jgi:hypothetical protein